MSKSYRRMERKATGKIREIQGGKVTLEMPLPMAEVLEGATEAVETLMGEAGRMLILAAMMSEAEAIAGRKHSKLPERKAHWWGNQKGYAYFAGRKIEVSHPRVRGKNGGETPLETYLAFQNPARMESAVARRLLVNVSARNYETAVDQFIEGYGVRKSSVSRHFVAATAQQLREFMERDLSGYNLCAIFIDGIGFAKHLLVVALGLDVEGRKHVLGIWQGATENEEVCRALLEDMTRRGLAMTGDYLFVLDGSKALRKAVTQAFGKNAAIQRCQTHKRRNVRGHLPLEHQAAIDARIRAAYNMSSHEDAKKSLELTARHLDRLNPSAAASLREGMEETLTVHKLGVPDALRKTLSTTNPIESTFSITRHITDRVKRWRGGDMVQRWAVAALLQAEKKFNRIKGYRDLPKLVLNLKEKAFDRKEVAA